MPPKSAKSKEAPAERPILGRFSSHLKIGIVGLPNVGKSTLFNTLTKLSIPAENFPFCTIEPNEARVNVPDERFEWLCQLYKPKNQVSAFLEIHDIAGLVRGAHEGQGLGNSFLSHIRAVDGIFHVLRAFEDPDIIHVDDIVDPVRDLEVITEELRLKDLEFMERKIEDVEKGMKRSNDKQLKIELELCQRVKAWIEQGKDVRLGEWKAADIEILNTFQLLSAKPVVYLVNMNEKDYQRKKNKFLPKLETNPLPLHLSHVQKPSLIINRTHSLLHSIALATLIYYRSSTIFQTLKTRDKPIFPLLFLSISELILSFIWVLSQAYRWRPVSRTAFPDRLPEDEELPAIDVFICTTDPNKEPTVDVMNTVVSAMAMDYPVDKLCVYLSDDGGSDVTLNAMKEAWRFAKCWVPFCKRFGVETRCPKAYFLEENHQKDWRSDFMAEKEKVKEKYEEFKKCMMSIREKANIIMTNRDHPPLVEVINEKGMNEEVGDGVGAQHVQIPLLVYVSREKRPSLPHHFKAGALNVLLRVSAMISNSPYILVLDCDMYCNDSSSARQAMCFHLDPKMSPSLAFVQFPQKFHNISKNDIYGNRARSIFTILWKGMDGLEGPCLSGTCFYMKRKALYGSLMSEDVDIMKHKQYFGSSNDFIKSLGRHYKPNHCDFSNAMLFKETLLLASCAYENQTKWGKEVGFLYFSVLEDYFTDFINLHGKGWISVYYDQARPAFLGSGTTNLSDVLVQSTRWSSGFVEVAISRFCPLLHGPNQKEKHMSVLERMCYAELAFVPFYFIPLWCFAAIPQLYLLNGIPLYPEVSSGYFIVFSFIFLSSQSKHIQEILSTGGSIQTWSDEQRMWMIRSVTSHLYGSLDAFMKRMGMREASFQPTNKAVDDEQLKRYQMGKFDFQASNMLIVPVVTLVILNLVSLFGGVTRMVVINGSFNEMLVQVGLSFFIVSMSYPIVEGMVVRKDKGRVPISVSILSAVISMIYLLLGSLIITYW